MARLVLFHHVLGLTDGVRELGERLAAGRHAVATPDLYGGQVASSIEDGFAIMKGIGDEELTRRADAAVEALEGPLVFAGISMGVATAQRFAQTRADAAGALLYEACLPVTGEYAIGPWPAGVPVQVHGMDADEFFAKEGDLDAARELVDLAGPQTAELFTYPGDRHLFTDSSLPAYDPDATSLLVERSLALLARIDR